MDMAEISKIFPTDDSCMDYLEKVLWKEKPTCPYCHSSKSTPIKDQKRYHCNNCNTAYSVTVNTIFHNTRLALSKWFLAIVLILNTQDRVSVRQLSRSLKVNKNTAWYLLSRIQKAMIQTDQRQLLLNLAEFKGD